MSNGILESWNIGIMEHCDRGILEWWNDGIMEEWNGGIKSKYQITNNEQRARILRARARNTDTKINAKCQSSNGEIKGNLCCRVARFDGGGLMGGFWKGLHFEKIAGFIFRNFAGLSFSFKSHSGMAHFDTISFFDPFFRYLSPIYSRAIG